MKPIVKWAGGKIKQCSSIVKMMPSKYNRYIEPFIGGGAIFFSINRLNSIIADINPELINLYRVVSFNIDELITDLRKHENTKEYFYYLRGLDRLPEFNDLSDVERASRFLFLNKTCFNGLCRYNASGCFNSSYGYYSKVNIDFDNFRECSELLRNTEIICSDFSFLESTVKEGDFVYLDPPYVPISDTSYFTSYSSNGFSIDDQNRLKDLCDLVTEKGAYFILSNSYCDYTLNLYYNYNLFSIEAARSINVDTSKRGNVTELLVTNFIVK